jgi:hypothetical protein
MNLNIPSCLAQTTAPGRTDRLIDKAEDKSELRKEEKQNTERKDKRRHGEINMNQKKNVALYCQGRTSQWRFPITYHLCIQM